MYELLKKLTQAYGPSANEKLVGDIIEEEIKPYVDEIRKDLIGNLLIVKKGGNKKVLIIAPMDQCCFLSTYVEDNGRIRFSVLSPIEPLEIVNNNVIFENNIIGVIKTEESNSPIKMRDLYINVGEKDDKSVKEKLPLGASAVLKGNFHENDLNIMSPALDGRTACLCLIEVIKSLPKNVGTDLYFLFSAQNKLGARGSKIIAQSIKPNIAISIDSASCKEHDYSGKGPVIRLRDKNMVSHPNLIKIFKDIAKNYKLPLQEQIAMNDISDVDGIVEAGIDAEVLSVALPIINYKSSNEIIYKSDIENLKKLLDAFVRESKVKL